MAREWQEQIIVLKPVKGIILSTGTDFSWADYLEMGSILAWIVILSVYGADTIAIDLSLSALFSWFMKSIYIINN